MVVAPPQARPLSLAPFEFCLQSGGNYALFQRSTVGPSPLALPPGGPSLVIWQRPLEATMPFSMVPTPPRPRPLRLAPQTPEFGLFEFCVWRQICLFLRSIVDPPPLPRTPGGPGLNSLFG